METNGILGLLTMNVANNIVGIQIKDYFGLLTLTIVKSNVRSLCSPVQQREFQSAASIRVELMIKSFVLYDE